jgi:hypothetical protein
MEFILKCFLKKASLKSEAGKKVQMTIGISKPSPGQAIISSRNFGVGALRSWKRLLPVRINPQTYNLFPAPTPFPFQFFLCE